MSKLAAGLITLALCASPLAAEPAVSDQPVPRPPEAAPAGPDKPAAPAKPSGGEADKPAAAVTARAHPVVGRLGLDDGQLAKVEPVLAGRRKALAEVPKSLGTGGKPVTAVMIHEKQREIRVEYDKRICEVLPAELQAKFEAGAKILSDVELRQDKLREGLVAAMREAGGDQEEMQKARKDILDKVRALQDELDRELDKQVGKLREPPKPDKGPQSRSP